MQPAAPFHPQLSPLRGISLALLAFALLTAMDCTVKALGSRYHVFQIVWLQTLVGLALMLVVTWKRGGLTRLRTRRPLLHVTRALLVMFSMTAIFYSYAQLPLANVYAVSFTVPLLVTALSGPPLPVSHETPAPSPAVDSVPAPSRSAEPPTPSAAPPAEPIPDFGGR